MKNFKDKRGFTLVEILVVVAIIGILAVISVPGLVQNVDKAKVTRLITKYDAFKKATISNMSSSEIKLDDKLIETITKEVYTVPEITPIGGKYSLTYLENEKAKCLDEEGNPLEDTTISWQVALGIVASKDNDIHMTDKQFKQLVKTLGNTNIVVKDDKNNEIYIKIVD